MYNLAATWLSKGTSGVRSIPKLLRLIGAGVLIAGCGRAPTAPDPPVAFRIVADSVIDMTNGETRALRVDDRDDGGAGIARPLTAYTWTTSDPDVVSVEPDGTIRAHADFGGAVITARSPEGRTASVRVWVQLPEHLPSTFRITLIFSDGIPASSRLVLEWAAEQWQRVIRAPLPTVTLNHPALPACGDIPGEPPLPPITGLETGTRIYVQLRPGGGGPAAGPCLHRPLPRPTVIIGSMVFGRRDPDPPFISDLIALHEMGHALGLVGLASGLSLPWHDRAASRYIGPYAIEGYRRMYGGADAFLRTSSGHWLFAGDVMSVDWEVRIAKVSVGALMDLGYPAAWYGAH